ncbi:DNA-directed RNA polymerase subunit beta' [Candidatus Falkowbacteria bacterium HGW-Falkowbacteria-2]|uniref:DNA-directed RNA polymerase subunit beta' n=1 Tax=Candidatus Falkowbacteria bacterium HGW-Falkowbacteria-2 TaxID=2013769 RepID=A0A2N2E061_9BACT|nr:MAG: DNA-directed RNA polymerase subunit beta' [Candidatus Falkowbacteria bacterium HGW-Falkowbacteria-2]
MLNPIKTSDFDAIRLKLASPEEILSWSHGEVIRPETINYRTQKPEKDGLFCEKIFGPTKDWECACGKYKKIRYKGIVCDKCGVEVTRSVVRRERMGHISMQIPCTHIWFLRGISSKIGLLLNLGIQSLEKVIYFASFIVTDVDEGLKETTLEQIKSEHKSKRKSIENDFAQQVKRLQEKGEVKPKSKEEKALEKAEKIEKGEKVEKAEKSEEHVTLKDLTRERDEKIENLEEDFAQVTKELKELKPLLILSEHQYQNLSLKFGHIFEAGIGAEAIRRLLERIDLTKSIDKIEEKLEGAVDSKRDKLVKRLKLLKSFRNNNLRPEWMILTTLPVVPPDLRPMVALDGGRFAASDLNDLYRRVINRNNRLKQLIDLNAPEVICRNEKRMLQEAVDALIDNSARHTKTVTASTGQKRQLKSLADGLKGKQGRFRQNLLGKRVDYSGRSVIVVNPKLNLDQCGLPKIMALELFKPFIISQLIKREIVHNVRSASRYIEAGHDEVWDILEETVKEAYVLLNRAPTLHRLGIQAFKPILIEGKAIQIHPLVCTAFNADFDGDQMAVHVPLTKEAKHEAATLMLSSHNLLKPATGDPIVAPGQDIVWGTYYITLEDPKMKNIPDKDLQHFYDDSDALLAYDNGYAKLHEPVVIKLNGERIRTTIGRMIFNLILPEKLRYINEVVGKGKLKDLIRDSLRLYTEEETVKFIDNLKNKSFTFITKSGLSWGFGDLPSLPEKDRLIEEANKKVDIIQEQYEEGLLTESERLAKVIEEWTNTKDKVADVCKAGLADILPVYSMIDSGARGSWAQPVQILGMKGLVTSPSGAIIELPVKGNFKEGFGVLEYFISTHGVRKGLSDTALRTANAGYLTRRLIDVAQDVIVTEDDCGDKKGVTYNRVEADKTGEDFYKKITGRYLATDVDDEKGKAIYKSGDLITEEVAKDLKQKNVGILKLRSALSCHLHKGVCAKCYGWDLAYNREVKLGSAVGIIAAQSIGEPGTQLTMRTFHAGGVAGQDDITQGLPRVEEIFEARSPKKKALISDVSGSVKIDFAQKTIKDQDGKDIIVPNPQAKILSIVYRGKEAEKYYFSEKINEMKLATGMTAKDKKKLIVEVLVKDGDKVSKGTELFKVAAETVKAKNGGVIAVNDKYVSVAKEVDKVKEYSILKGTMLMVKDGDAVEKGTQLTEGSLDLRELYKLKGELETQKYIIREIQYVYSSQGQPLNDKHIEVIARQMFSRFLIKDPGDTAMLPGETVEAEVFEHANLTVKVPAKGDRLLMGITKASLTTDSFLSAASFQETPRVLIEAAVNGKIDFLEGLKENVIIGCLIPAGTGYKGKKVRDVYEPIQAQEEKKK